MTLAALGKQWKAYSWILAGLWSITIGIAAVAFTMGGGVKGNDAAHVQLEKRVTDVEADQKTSAADHDTLTAMVVRLDDVIKRLDRIEKKLDGQQAEWIQEQQSPSAVRR